MREASPLHSTLHVRLVVKHVKHEENIDCVFVCLFVCVCVCVMRVLCVYVYVCITMFESCTAIVTSYGYLRPRVISLRHISQAYLSGISLRHIF